MKKPVLALLCAIVLFWGCKCEKECECPDVSCMPETVNNGLVAYFPFNGNSQDESGYGNHTIFNNATLTSDRYNQPGKAYLFNGVNNYMRVANSGSLNPDRLSMVAIVKVNGFYQGKCHGNVIINKGDDDVTMVDKFRLRFDDNVYTNGQNCNNSVVDSVHQVFYGDFGGNSGISLPYNGPYIEKGKWYCVAYTFDGSIGKLYVNGVMVSSRPAGSGVYQPSTDDLFIGKLNDGLFPYWFNGVMDEIRIYNRAISQEEVTALCTDCNKK